MGDATRSSDDEAFDVDEDYMSDAENGLRNDDCNALPSTSQSQRCLWVIFYILSFVQHFFPCVYWRLLSFFIYVPFNLLLYWCWGFTISSSMSSVFRLA